MEIKSVQFIKGVVGPDPTLEDGTPQVAFIGRSNAGKSSVINTLVNNKGAARVSSFPGRTQELNLFLINESLYFVDLPGYGYAKAPWAVRNQLEKRIYWYLFESQYVQKKVIMIVDANVGLKEADKDMLYSLDEHDKDVVIIANKIDKIKSSMRKKQLQSIKDEIGSHMLIPYSAEKKIGVQELLNEIL